MRLKALESNWTTKEKMKKNLDSIMHYRKIENHAKWNRWLSIFSIMLALINVLVMVFVGNTAEGPEWHDPWNGSINVVTPQTIVRLSMAFVTAVTTYCAVKWSRQRYVSMDQVNTSTAIINNASFKLRTISAATERQSLKSRLGVIHELGVMSVQETTDITVMRIKNDKTSQYLELKQRNKQNNQGNQEASE